MRLLGGETAEMPGFYQPGDYELVGFVVGMVDHPKLSRRVPQSVPAGSSLGLPSSGLHTNGYSLARRILFDVMGLSPGDSIPGIDDGRSVSAHLLDVHRTYLPPIKPLLDDPRLKGLAHITGGGLTDNLPRILPPELRANVDLDSWQVPTLFQVLQRAGDVHLDEMLRVFNMGVGMALVIDPQALDDVTAALRASGEEPWVLGRIEEGGGGVVYEGASLHGT